MPVASRRVLTPRSPRDICSRDRWRPRPSIEKELARARQGCLGPPLPHASPIRIQDSIQRVNHWEWIVTTVTTDSGLTGTGFAYTGGLGGTAIRELVDTYLAPLVRGQDPRDVERVWTRCWWELHSLGSGGLTRYAIATVDIALWDILAKHAGVPLYRLLGGARDRIRAYGSGINMHLDGEPLLDQMRGFLDRGYRAVKMKVGRDNPEEDVERVGAVRRLVGPRGPADAGRQPEVDGGRSDPAGADADAASRRSGSRSRCWPTTASRTAGSARARAFPSRPARRCTPATSSPTSCGAGPSTWSRRTSCGSAASPSGSRSPSSPRASTCRWRPTSSMELSIHALCAVPNGLILEDLQGGSFTDLGLLAEPIRVERGELAPPARPGPRHRPRRGGAAPLGGHREADRRGADAQLRIGVEPRRGSLAPPRPSVRARERRRPERQEHHAKGPSEQHHDQL